MSGFSDYLAAKILDSTLNKTAFTTTKDVWVALFTADPTDAFTTSTEVDRVTRTWYARQPAGTFSISGTGVASNITDVAFSAVAGSAVTITHVGLVEGTSATDPSSKLLYSYALTEPKTLAIYDIYLMSAGDFTITLL